MRNPNKVITSSQSSDIYEAFFGVVSGAIPAFMDVVSTIEFTHPQRIAKRSSLNSQILFSVVTAAIVIFSLVSTTTVLHERNRMLNVAKEDAQKIVEQNHKAVALALWKFDHAGLNAILKGLTQSGSIINAEILENNTLIEAQSRQNNLMKPDVVWDVELTAPDSTLKIGTLRISESYDSLRQSIAFNGIALIASELIKIGGLAALLFVIVNQLATRHLKSLAQQIEQTNLNRDEAVQGETVREISIQRSGNRRDELTTLIDAFNRYRFEHAEIEKELLSDIAERKRVESALQESEASLSDAMKIASLGYWEYLVETEEFIFNDQYYSLHHTSREIVGGYRMSLVDFAQRFLHIEDAPSVISMLRTATQQKDYGFLSQIETRIQCADGAVRWILIRFKIMRDADGKLLRLIGANQDITDRKLAEQQSLLLARLSAQKETAELANQAKSRFLAAASHDLRQPIHALHLFLGTLSNIELPEAARRPLANVLRCTESIDEMFVALLDVAKLDAGVIEPQLSAFPIMEVLSRIRHECAPQSQEKGVAFHVVPCTAWIKSDPLMVERIVRNLATNAIRYTNTGKIVIGCRRRPDDMLEIVVYDTGVGIAAGQQEKIFGEFYKAGFSQANHIGLGLGLSIVDQLAKLLAAPLKVYSAEGKGSQFSICLPRTMVDQLDYAVERQIDSNHSLEGRHLLVLDDDLSILDATRSLLEQLGCVVMTADTVASAMKQLMDAERLPDAMICDYRLRGKENGADAISMIRDEFNADIPALLITADTSPKKIVQLNLTGLPVLHKPLREREFKKALIALLTPGEHVDEELLNSGVAD